MRNLKKFLALVMAMVMAFSLMVTANAATTGAQYKDADDVEDAFQVAVDVLTGMLVFKGDDRGFRPGENISRAEVAALLYRLSTGDVKDQKAGLYANYGNFVDVNPGDWFAGYVGYCANAGYIKGRAGNVFDPYAPVTGYEALAMVLRAVGYDQNGEFTGITWQTNVSAMGTQLGVLKDVKTTHYGDILYLASRRDVVASIMFQAAQIPTVTYTQLGGYNKFDSLLGTDLNPSLGWKYFGLTNWSTGILLGNKQTGESASRMGYAGSYEYAYDVNAVTGGDIMAKKDWSAYTYQGSTIANVKKDDSTVVLSTIGENWKFDVDTNISLVGHRLDLWFDGSSYNGTDGFKTYAYYDKADTTVVYADTTELDPSAAQKIDENVDLAEAISGAGFKTNGKAVFNNSFGKFGTDFTGTGVTITALNSADAAQTYSGADVAKQTDDKLLGNGTAAKKAEDIKSPVGLYKIIDNNGDKVVDAVISLNIESSQITESNVVRDVETVGMPVNNAFTYKDNTVTAAWDSGDPTDYADSPQNPQWQTQYIVNNTSGVGGRVNTKTVGSNSVYTGVIAKDAVVGNSTKALGDYEFGIHITGTDLRTVSAAEKAAINGTGAETSRYLLWKVTAPVEGTVVNYNNVKGTVTLSDGTVLERSKYYDTVVIKNPANGSCPNKVTASIAPESAIPQAWLHDTSVTADTVTEQWVEGYANTNYKFYLDFEGKYLGAERSFGSTFLYGTYMDYSQEVSSSTFKYFLTGIDLNGEKQTVQVSKLWQDDSDKNTQVHDGDPKLKNINDTKALGVPYHNPNTATDNVGFGMGPGVYTGYVIMGTNADGFIYDAASDRNEYLNNMARLGINNAAKLSLDGTTDDPAFDVNDITITSRDTVLGVKETVTGQGKYLTEATKFILVSGYGTDSAKGEVYHGISDLMGTASQVVIDMNSKDVVKAGGGAGAKADTMTYYTESNYTYAQTGATSKQIDTIILPKEAVTWIGGSGLYYVGDPAPSLTNSWGADAWKYTLYMDGEPVEMWLANDPNKTTGASDGIANALLADTFYQVRPTGEKTNDGQTVYVAAAYDTSGSTPVWDADLVLDYHDVSAMANSLTTPDYANQVIYSAQTTDSHTGRFDGSGFTGGSADLLRVDSAKIVNLNKGTKEAVLTWETAINSGTQTKSSGEYWPGISDLATLNQAGSMNPVTGTRLKVSVVVDSNNPLIATVIYVCYDQTIRTEGTDHMSHT